LKENQNKSKQLKVLVIEDDVFLLRILDVKLSREGLNVIKAVDGEQAVDLTLKEIPDLILLDLILPKKDGFDVLREIKDNPKTQAIPVLILSNLGQEVDIERGLELGAVDYLVKTRFSINAVIEKVKQYLPGKGRSINMKEIVKKRNIERKKEELNVLRKKLKEMNKKIKGLEGELE
jgi:DNA-binding response OmpR family regulator